MTVKVQVRGAVLQSRNYAAPRRKFADEQSSMGEGRVESHLGRSLAVAASNRADRIRFVSVRTRKSDRGRSRTLSDTLTLSCSAYRRRCFDVRKVPGVKADGTAAGLSYTRARTHVHTQTMVEQLPRQLQRGFNVGISRESESGRR